MLASFCRGECCSSSRARLFIPRAALLPARWFRSTSARRADPDLHRNKRTQQENVPFKQPRASLAQAGCFNLGPLICTREGSITTSESQILSSFPAVSNFVNMKCSKNPKRSLTLPTQHGLLILIAKSVGGLEWRTGLSLDCRDINMICGTRQGYTNHSWSRQICLLSLFIAVEAHAS